MSEQSADRGGNKTRSRIMMVCLFALFLSPIAVAWLYTSGLLDLGETVRTNRGELLNPPLDLREADDMVPLFERAGLQPGQWILASLGARACEQQCREIDGKLSTIRSLLGYSGQRVQILNIAALAPASTAPAQAHLFVDEEVYESLRTRLSARDIDITDAQIFLLDWRKQLVVRFAHDAPSIDIKKDLKRLLRASKIR